MKENRSSQRNRSVHNIQLLLWTLLILLQMTMVHCLEGKAEEQPAPASEISIYMEEGPEPEPVWTDAAGNEYELVSWQMVSARQPARTRPVKEMIYYDQVEGASVIPRELTIPVTEGNQTCNAVCQIQEQTVLQEEWQEDFVFSVVFHIYGAGFYQLGDHLIAGNEENPELAGCEALLLEQVGVSPEDYRISYVQWTGDGYLDAQGELCRNALAFGQKLVRDYQVTYVGQAEFPERNVRQIEAVYHLAEPEKEPETDATISDLTDIPEVPVFFELADSAEAPLSKLEIWRQKVIDTLLITVGIGAILFLGGLVMLALLRLVKMVIAWYNEKNWYHKRHKKEKAEGSDHVYRE